jgi:flagellar motor component MotA
VKEFTPPISIRDTEELIAIIYSLMENWQREAIDQAKEELKRRGIAKDYIEYVVDGWAEEKR